MKKHQLTANEIRGFYHLDDEGHLFDLADKATVTFGPRRIALALHFDDGRPSVEYTRQHLEDFLRRHDRAQSAACAVAFRFGAEVVKDALSGLGAKKIGDLPFHKLQALLGHFDFLLVRHASKLEAEQEAAEQQAVLERGSSIALDLSRSLLDLVGSVDYAAVAALPEDHEASKLIVKVVAGIGSMITPADSKAEAQFLEIPKLIGLVCPEREAGDPIALEEV